MNTPNSLTFRLISAAAAACTTLVLFSAVVSIGEPQMSALMAHQQGQQGQQARQVQSAQPAHQAVPAGDAQLAAVRLAAEAVSQ